MIKMTVTYEAQKWDFCRRYRTVSECLHFSVHFIDLQFSSEMTEIMRMMALAPKLTLPAGEA